MFSGKFSMSQLLQLKMWNLNCHISCAPAPAANDSQTKYVMFSMLCLSLSM